MQNAGGGFFDPLIYQPFHTLHVWHGGCLLFLAQASL